MARHEALRVFLVGSEFFRLGGIQHVNRTLIHALEAASANFPLELSVFSRKDAGTEPACKTGTFRFHGAKGNLPAFSGHLAGMTAILRPHIILFTHVRLLPLAWACKLLSPETRIAVLCHGIEVWEKANRGTGRSLALADWVLSPSQFTRKRLMECHRVPAERIQVIPHGLGKDWDFSSIAPKTAFHAPRLLTVCRMSRDDSRYGTKGVDTLLEAMPTLREQFPGIRLAVVGDGDDRARLEAKRDELQLQSCVEFLGPLTDPQLRQEYARATLFVLPSDLEGFGIVFLEAMAYGLPVIARKAAASPELVQDGVTGALVVSPRASDLANVISRLLVDSDLRGRMSAAARLAVSENFLFEAFAGRWQQWLSRALPEQTYLVRHTPIFSRSWKSLDC